MKKILMMLLAVLMLAGCTTSSGNDTPVDPTPTPDSGSNNEETPNTESTVVVKTGYSVNDVWGTTVANVIEIDGEVAKILVDTVRNGESSKEKHDSYGIKPNSSLGKDWWEQVMFYETWVKENGVDTVEYDEDGHALNEDLISGCTINISNFTEAVKNASEEAGEVVKTGYSVNPVWGVTVANVIVTDGAVEKILIDTVRDGESSKEKFDNYGIKPNSSLGKDWWEQVMFYETWVKENGVDAVEYDEDGHALNEDLISGATINISNFTEAVKGAMSEK